MNGSMVEALASHQTLPAISKSIQQSLTLSIAPRMDGMIHCYLCGSWQRFQFDFLTSGSPGLNGQQHLSYYLSFWFIYVSRFVISFKLLISVGKYLLIPQLISVLCVTGYRHHSTPVILSGGTYLPAASPIDTPVHSCPLSVLHDHHVKDCGKSAGHYAAHLGQLRPWVEASLSLKNYCTVCTNMPTLVHLQLDCPSVISWGLVGT